MCIRDSVKVPIKNSDIVALHTVGGLCDFVARRMREQRPSA